MKSNKFHHDTNAIVSLLDRMLDLEASGRHLFAFRILLSLLLFFDKEEPLFCGTTSEDLPMGWMADTSLIALFSQTQFPEPLSD